MAGGDERVVVGIDPGSHKCGYAVMVNDALMGYGAVNTYSKDIVARVQRIEIGLRTMFHEQGVRPDVIAWETPYSGTGAGAAGKSGLQQVWMVIGMLCTLPSEQFMPLHVATVQATWGRKRGLDRKAGKEMSVRLANERFGIELESSESDVSDAIWVAVTAMNKLREADKA